MAESPGKAQIQAMAGQAGSAVKEGIVRSLRGINEIECEMVGLVRIMGVRDVGGDVLGGARQVIRGTVGEAADIGADVGQVALKTLDGVIEAAEETGLNAEEMARVTLSGAVETLGSIGNTAVRATRDILVNAVQGVKEAAGAAVPRGQKQSAAERELRNDRCTLPKVYDERAGF